MKLTTEFQIKSIYNKYAGYCKKNENLIQNLVSQRLMKPS